MDPRYVNLPLYLVGLLTSGPHPRFFSSPSLITNFLLLYFFLVSCSISSPTVRTFVSILVYMYQSADRSHPLLDREFFFLILSYLTAHTLTLLVFHIPPFSTFCSYPFLSSSGITDVI